MRKKTLLRLCIVFYAVALVFWTVWGSICAVRASKATSTALSVQNAAFSSIRDDYPVDWGCWQTGSLLTTDGDAFLIWQPDVPVSGLKVQITSSQPVQDMLLYYSLAGEADFTHWVQPTLIEEETGTYLFRLPGTVSVERLRLDPTSAAGAFFRLDEIILNPAYPLWRSWLPDFRTAVCLIVLPGFAALLTEQSVHFSCTKFSKKES